MGMFPSWGRFPRIVWFCPIMPVGVAVQFPVATVEIIIRRVFIEAKSENRLNLKINDFLDFCMFLRYIADFPFHSAFSFYNNFFYNRMQQVEGGYYEIASRSTTCRAEEGTFVGKRGKYTIIPKALKRNKQNTYHLNFLATCIVGQIRNNYTFSK